MLVVVDRTEGNWAVIEFLDRTTRDVPVNELPLDLKPGECLWYKGARYVPAPEETAKRHDKIKELMKSMWTE